MFARSTLRAAAPLRQSYRTYASKASTPVATTSTPWIVLAAAIGTGAFGYNYLGNQRTAHAEAATSKKAFTGGDQGFLSLKLVDVEDYNHNTKKFKFALPEDDMVSGLSVASAVITKFKDPSEDKPTIRPYTPVSDESDKGHMDLLVKVYPNGAMSNYLHSMSPGQTLDIKGPIPKYPWSENKHTSIALIAGGTGITPMYQLTRAIFNNPNDNTKVALIFGNISESDILLKEEFDRLEKEYPDRFKAFYTLDKPSKEWKHGKGFITKELLSEVLPDAGSENIKVFVCGPPPLYKAISGTKASPQDQGELSGILKELGYSKDQVYKF